MSSVLNKLKTYLPRHRKSDLEAKYKVGEELGSGNFSIVRLCTNRTTGQRFALKIIDKSLVAGKEEMIETETEILRRAKHVNIVSMIEAFDTPSKLYIVMDLATGGELFDRIVAKGSYTERDASHLVREILEGIAYLHERDIVHRDLKPENLLFSDPSDEARIMITDFGLSKFTDTTSSSVLMTACGTPGYVAPEILRQCGYGKSVDNWSIGVIAYILLCGYPPFYDEDQATLFQTIMAGVFDFHVEYWSHISDSAKDLIRRLLTVDPAQRLTAEEALRHPWIAQEGGSASNIDIHESFTTQLAKFNARRKLRAAMKTVAMVTRLKRLGLNAAEATADEQEETSDSSPLGSPTTEFAQ